MFRSRSRSKFNLSHQVNFSADMGKLYPCCVLEVVPGDRFDITSQHVMRFSPLLAPVLHHVDAHVHYFFVPNRLVWENWEEFITGGEKYDPNNPPVPPVMPTIKAPAGGWTEGSLQDYLGLPTGVAGADASALALRGYHLIYNEWYRQQDLQDPLPIDKGDGTATPDATVYPVLTANWQQDYFTTALPYPQKGPASMINISFSGKVPVIGIGVSGGSATPDSFSPEGQGVALRMSDGTVINTPGALQRPTAMIFSTNGSPSTAQFLPAPTSIGIMSKDPTDPNFKYPDIYADMSNASVSAGVSINDLRQALQIQKWMEINARCGSRYVEFIQAHFGVASPDARLQRPEFLGGKRTPVIFSEVLQTAPTTDTNPRTTPLATMAGHGFSAGRSRRIKHSFVEHGYVIGIFSIRPRTAYQQGTHKHFLRSHKFDYLTPEFAHLGEQAILNAEIFTTGDPVKDTGIFGYQARYEEYRRMPSRICGDFKKDLLYWHLGRVFEQAPLLNDSFLKCDPSTRIFAVEEGTDNKIYVQFENVVHAVRPLPKRGTPGLMN